MMQTPTLPGGWSLDEVWALLGRRQQEEKWVETCCSGSNELSQVSGCRSRVWKTAVLRHRTAVSPFWGSDQAIG
ncbi:MAG: hypothetical protein KJ069_10295 [Anaerolineae bacterium]|nr:hypothetical protein [Anaerolineae bacterium]